MPHKNEDILQQVRKLCVKRGLRLTQIRREVLELLLNSPKPVKAYTLLTQQKSGARQPTVIYRALDFLQQNGFAHKIHSQNSYIACHHPQQAHDCYFLICRHCGITRECCNKNTTDVINQLVQQNAFKKPKAFVEIFADCNICAPY